MGLIRRRHSSKTKLEAAIAMVSGKAPVAELCQKYGVHQSVLQRWKRELLDKGGDIFSTRKKPTEEHTPDDFQRKIGQLTMELDFLKKALGK